MLSAIARALVRALEDDACAHRALAAELAARGFGAWQAHGDARALLRALVLRGAPARGAAVQIAEAAPALVVGVLAQEIMTPKDVGTRRAVMQLVAFLVRKVCDRVARVGRGADGDEVEATSDTGAAPAACRGGRQVARSRRGRG
jgi:hypothetical protein